MTNVCRAALGRGLRPAARLGRDRAERSRDQGTHCHHGRHTHQYDPHRRSNGRLRKYMAPSRSKTVGLFGASPQCKTQLMALKASLPQLEKAYVYDLSRERAEKFAAEMSQKLNMDVQAASDRLATIESGDILVTATTATEPIIHGAEIKKGRLRCSPWQQRGRRGADPARGQGRHRRLGDRQAPHGRHDGLHVPRRQDRRFRH